MSKKPSRKQRKDARARAQRAGVAPPPEMRRKFVRVAAPVPDDRDESDEPAEAGDDTPVPRKGGPASAASSRAAKRKRNERAMLFFVALVAVAGVIAYLAMNRGTDKDKTVMVPETPPQPSLKPGTEIAPPIEVRAPTPTAPPVDSSPPTIVPATAAAKPAAPPQAKPTATAAAAAPKKPAATAAPKKPASSDPY